MERVVIMRAWDFLVLRFIQTSPLLLPGLICCHGCSFSPFRSVTCPLPHALPSPGLLEAAQVTAIQPGYGLMGEASGPPLPCYN